MDLPKELRDMVFEEHFRDQDVNVHNANNARCEATKATRPNTSSNVFLVSKQFNEEAKPHYLANTAFHLSDNCWGLDSPAEDAPIADIKNIVLNYEVHHDHWCSATPTRGFQKSLASECEPEFSTITWVRPLLPTDYPALSRLIFGKSIPARDLADSMVEKFVRTALDRAKTVIFQMRPQYCTGHSWDRDCEVSLAAGGPVKILGRSRHDTELIAVDLCRMFEEIEPSTIIHLQGPSPRIDYETAMAEQREKEAKQRLWYLQNDPAGQWQGVEEELRRRMPISRWATCRRNMHR